MPKISISNNFEKNDIEISVYDLTNKNHHKMTKPGKITFDIVKDQILVFSPLTDPESKLVNEGYITFPLAWKDSIKVIAKNVSSFTLTEDTDLKTVSVKLLTSEKLAWQIKLTIPRLETIDETPHNVTIGEPQ